MYNENNCQIRFVRKFTDAKLNDETAIWRILVDQNFGRSADGVGNFDNTFSATVFSLFIQCKIFI